MRAYLTPSVTAAPCQTFGVPLACLPHSGRQALRPRGGSSGAYAVHLTKNRFFPLEETLICKLFVFAPLFLPLRGRGTARRRWKEWHDEVVTEGVMPKKLQKDDEISPFRIGGI